MMKLEYNIHKYSSFSSIYVPENIKVNNNQDQSSRWSSESNCPPQFLVLKLLKPAIVHTILFGKYEHTHVCNIRKFKVYGGLKEDQMIELLEGGLRNNNEEETFTLRYILGGQMFPVRYIKIIPLLSWGLSFNFSIWYVQLNGINDQDLVQPSAIFLNMYREQEIVRLCMKHFRQHNYLKALKGLEEDTGVVLENRIVGNFHDVLVEQANYEEAEALLENASREGLFRDYICKQEYQQVWEMITPTADSSALPGMRGGHQMVIDSDEGVIYLFGGWDGSKDLNDFWIYNIETKKWFLKFRDAAEVGGPSPRSCHKMCLDPRRKQLFLLGRFLDTPYRVPRWLNSDFYMYDIDAGEWVLISEDTSEMGGPPLIFDHQMCIDTQKRRLYVFGGRVLVQNCSANIMANPPQPELVYSGLYCFHVATSTWELLLRDVGQASNPDIPTVISRVGHSMVFHCNSRKLYIFAGQRNKDYMTDLFTYNIDTRQVEVLSSEVKSELLNYPAPGFTQRATIDVENDEIFVLSGLSKDKYKREDYLCNSLWVYKIKENKWIWIYNTANNDITGYYHDKNSQCAEPCPRFAHQLVYDEKKKLHYLFGGNPGRQITPHLRLDDFWILKLCRSNQSQLLQKCKLLIRRHRFEEMAETDPIEAVVYLRTKLSEVVDHNDQEQMQQFHILASHLFTEPDNSQYIFKDANHSDRQAEKEGIRRYLRTKLFDKLVQYFPMEMTQPKSNIADIVEL